jgi:hypothetical membrane protein
MIALAVAGIAGPVLFWAFLLLAQSLHPSYNPRKDSISRLIFGPFGWLQTANFCFLTVFTAAFGAAVYLYVATSIFGRVASLLILLTGLAQLLTAAFRVDVDPYGPKSLAYVVHNAVFIVSAGFFPVGALLLAPGLVSDERWRPFAFVTIGAAAIVLVLGLAWVMARSVRPRVVDPWFGIFERILLSIPLAWMMVISARLLFLSRTL